MLLTRSASSKIEASISPYPKEESLPRIWIQPYYKAFNGLRGFAVLLVFICHYALFWRASWVANITWEGVDLFFVLSGFLITGILYDSLDGTRFFRNFYVRRALRIFPIFYGFFLVLLFLTPLLHLRYPLSLLFYVIYVGNLIIPFADLAHRNPTIIFIVRHGQNLPVANIGHLWSLCVEEQFYLLWPAVVWWVRHRKPLLHICASLIVATIAFRICLVFLLLQRGHDLNNQNLIFWGTFTRCDTLLIGAWLALWLREKALSPLQLKQTAAVLFCGSIASIALGELLSAPHMRGPRGPFMSTVGFTLVAVAFAALILRCLDESSRVSRLFQSPALSSLGIVSYGFYLFHGLFENLWVIFKAHHPSLSYGIPLLAFASTLFISHLSFRYIETPFLRLKRVLAPQLSPPHGRPGHLHLSVPEVDS